MNDRHMHYTGSLPMDFIVHRLASKRPVLGGLKPHWELLFGDLEYGWVLDNLEEPVKVRRELENKISSVFGNDARDNLEKFFKLYKIIQLFTKPSDNESVYEVYSSGTYSIATENLRGNVDEFEILAGPTGELKSTQERIEGMLDGLRKLQKEKNVDNYGKIRLTFIRTSEGKYKNFSNDFFSQLLDYINNRSSVRDRITGFDFSGVETMGGLKEAGFVVRQVRKFNQANSKRQPLNVSVHAGENLFDFSNKQQLDFFKELLEDPPDKIVHATFLWTFNGPRSESLIGEKKKLLKKMVERGCVLQICPTANLRLSPISGYSSIPLSLFDNLGLKYSINTDNKTIFCTNLKKELESVGLRKL